MDIFRQIAEQRITEAMQRGEFDDLALKGRKLDLREDPLVPVELRMAHKILQTAGVLPEELSLEHEIRSLQALIDSCTDSRTDSDLANEIRSKLLQLNILMERRGRSAALQDYLCRLEKTSADTS